MEHNNGSGVGEVQHLRDVAWKAIESATVDGSKRERYWRAWKAHCRLYLLNYRGPSLPPSNIEDMLLTFAVAVREVSTALAVRSRFSQSQLLSGPSPKDTFWMDIATRVAPHQPSML